MISFGAMVSALRRSKKLTIQELADEAGISRNYMSQIERDIERGFTVDVLCRVAKALGKGEMPFVAGYIRWKRGEPILISMSTWEDL